jgi:ABC-type branched-subunit amino acid transport system ATPase component
MAMVMSVCDYIYVIKLRGQPGGGNAAEIRANRDVINAYLGEDTDA